MSPFRHRPFPLGERTTVVTAGQSVAKVAELGVAVILVRLLSPPDWATMALLLSIYSVANGLGGMNLHQGIYFFYGRVPEGSRRNLAVQTTGLLALTGVVAAALIWGLVPVLAGAPYRVQGLLPLIALTVLLEVPTLGAPQLLIAAELVGWSGAFTAIAAVLRVLAVTTPLFLGFGLRGAVLGLLGYAAVRLLAYVLILVRITPPGPIRFDPQSIRDQVRYSLPLGLSLATTLLNRDVGKWIVAAFRPGDFGSYAIAATEVPFISMLPYAMGAVLATRLVGAFRQGQLGTARAYWLAATSRASLMVLPATVAVLLCAPQLLPLLFTHQYAAAVLPFQIFSLILLHRVAEYGGILRAAGDTRALWQASLIVLGGNFCFGLPLTMAFGTVGMALGGVVANVLSWSFALARIARILRTPIRNAFPWPLYVGILAVSIAAGLIATVVSSIAPEGLGIQLFVRAAIFAVAVLSGMYAFRLDRRVPELPAEGAPALAPETTS